MKPGLYYQMLWDTMDSPGRLASQNIEVRIFDLRVQIEDDQNAQIIPLIPYGDPLTISVINNDQDKFQPIRGKQAVIRCISQRSQGIDFSTFQDAPDNNFYVVITTGATTIFIGYLMLPDAQKLFQPDPQILELTASDHLASLKDIALTTDTGENPKGVYKIGELIGLCLKKTGLSLGISVINNLRTGTGYLETTAIFSDAGIISFPFSAAGFFYEGQTFTITGSVSNDNSYTVVGIGFSVVTLVYVAESVTNEALANVILIDSNSNGHFYDKCFLDVLTFEKEIGVSEDCYTVLSKILGDDCFLFQRNGRWWICRVDEYDGNDVYIFEFNVNGQYEGPASGSISPKAVGFDEDTCFVNANQILKAQRPHNRIKETFNYDYPIELICNQDFAQGGYESDLPAVTEDGIVYQAKRYTITCWDYAVHKSMGQSPDPAEGDAYIKRLFFDDVEKQRMIEIVRTAPVGVYRPGSIKSSPVEVSYQDKIEIALDTRWSDEFSDGDVTATIGLELVGRDGNYYYMTDTGNWFQYLPGSNYIIFISNPNVGAREETKWQGNSYTSQPLPVSGKLYVYISEDAEAGTTYINHTGFSFEIKAFINGSYGQISGHYNQITRAGEPGYTALRENEVYIGDAPRRAMKGAILIASGTDFTLAQKFYTASTFAMGYPPDSTYMHPYGYIQAFSVWNQFREACRILSGDVLGLGADYAELLPRYSITDITGDTINRYFMLISFGQGWKSGVWQATFIECFRLDRGKFYSDTHEFKYIT